MGKNRRTCSEDMVEHTQQATNESFSHSGWSRAPCHHRRSFSDDTKGTARSSEQAVGI